MDDGHDAADDERGGDQVLLRADVAGRRAHQQRRRDDAAHLETNTRSERTPGVRSCVGSAESSEVHISGL